MNSNNESLKYFIGKICTIFTMPINRNFKEENPNTFIEQPYHYFLGVIEKITLEKVNATVHIKLKSGYVMTSVITRGAVENLGLKEGDEIIVIFKSSSALLSMDEKINISARNKLSGVIEAVHLGEVNAEVIVNVGGDLIACIITKDSIEELGIKIGDKATVIIKSSDVMIGK